MEIIAGDSGKDIESEDEITPFTSNVNRKGIQMCSELENYYLTNDPDTERALKFQRELNLCMSTYRELYKQDSKPAKQKLITDYIRNANPTSMEPPASPSRSDVYISSSDESDFTPNPKRMRNMRVLSDSISDDVNLFFDSDVS